MPKIYNAPPGFEFNPAGTSAELAALKAENEKLRVACSTGWGEPTLINTLKAERDALRAEVAELRANKPLQIDDDDGYVDGGREISVTLPPADVLALQTLAGQWTNAMSFLRVRYGKSSDRDSIDGWVDEFRSAVQRLAGLSDRIDAAIASNHAACGPVTQAKE